MTLAVIGMGLVSPLGLRPSEHAFFVRAGGGSSPLGAFVDEAGDPLRVAHCPWLGANRPAGERLAALASTALDSALEPLRTRLGEEQRKPALVLCTAAAMPTLSDADRAGVRPIARTWGAAGFFEALAAAEQHIAAGAERAIVVMTVDSLASLQTARETMRRPPSPWARPGPPLSEAAAALLVAAPEEAARMDLRVLGLVHHAAVRPGTSSDEDDEIVDGTALGALLAGLPPLPGRITQSFGPHNVDSLRHLEWTYAAARNFSAFDRECLLECIEDSVGAVGAAAGGVHLVYGLAAELHGTSERDGNHPLCAWAISRDGTRGLAIASGADAYG